MTRPRTLVAAGAAALVVVAIGSFQLLRPLTPPQAKVNIWSTYTVPGPQLRPDWPTYGQSTVALDGTGIVAATPDQPSVPIASVTKLMTALVVVLTHPLGVGDPGPMVQVTSADRVLYEQEAASGDSVVPVITGESLSELQLLEGLLLPSADNLARLLAQWDAGSVPGFVARMNQLAVSLGMVHSHFADSSGLDPGSRSTADDLVRLAAAVMAQPVLAEVAAMASATLPVVGTVHNYDFVLGQEGIVGLKTGWTSTSGGCFVSAARRQVGGRTALLLTAVLGAPGGPISSIRGAEAASVTLLASIWPALRVVSPLPRVAFAAVRSQWQAPVPLRPSTAPDQLGWPGLRFRIAVRTRRLADQLRAGTVAATLTVSTSDQPGRRLDLVTVRRLLPPSPGWRLLHG